MHDIKIFHENLFRNSRVSNGMEGGGRRNCFRESVNLD